MDMSAPGATSTMSFDDPGADALDTAVKTEATDADADTPPAPKKSRTNTPWTPAEEKRLKIMRDAGSTWSEIAKVCRRRLPRSLAADRAC